MANAKNSVIDPHPIKLELTIKEARSLLTALRAVGGLPHNSPRGYIDNIFDALVDAEIVPYSDDSTNGTVNFKDYKETRD